MRDVATHVVSDDELSWPATVAAFLRGGSRTANVNRVALRRYRSLERDDIIDLVVRHLHPRGLRLVADDVAWSTGQGPEVTGPGEALVIAVAGRPDALDELMGVGLSTLRERVARPR